MGVKRMSQERSFKIPVTHSLPSSYNGHFSNENNVSASNDLKARSRD